MRVKGNLRFLLFLLIFVFDVFSSPEVTLKLGTATKGLHYYNLGLSIKKICESKIPGLKIEVLPTEGSVSNILLLKEKKIDLAIVQNDIAFFAEQGVQPFGRQIKGLRGILCFYAEPIFIVTNRNNVRHIGNLQNYKIAIGPKGSGLSTDAKIILNAYQILDFVETKFAYPVEVVDLLKNNEIQGAFVNFFPPGLESYIINGEFFILPVSHNIIVQLTGTYPYFTEYSYFLNGEIFYTIAEKSILITRDDVDEDLIYNITKLVYNNYNLLTLPDEKNDFYKNNILQSMSLSELHPGSLRFFDEVKIFKLNKNLTYIWYFLMIPITLLIIVLSYNIILLVTDKGTLKIISPQSKILKFLKFVNIQVIQHKYITIILIIFYLFVTDILGVKYFEHQWAIENNNVSQFDNQSFGRNLLWMFVFGSSGYEDKLFPQSPMGKFLATLIPLMGIGGILTLLGFLTSDHVKKKLMEAKGMSTRNIKDHIIICGWNQNVPFLVKYLTHKNIVHKRHIVILADIDEEYPLTKFGIDSEWVSYVRGDATNIEDLKNANIKDADIAIIVADEKHPDPDANTILKGLTIEKYGHQLEIEGVRKNRENIYTIAEIVHQKNSMAAEKAYIDEIISFGEIRTKFFAMAVNVAGVSKVLDEVLTYNDYNDFYSYPLPENSKLVGKTFDELLPILRRKQMLLISINVVNHREKREAEKRVKEFGLHRGVITNPIRPEEINYRTHPKDLLIILAQNEKVVDEGIKNLEKELNKDA